MSEPLYAFTYAGEAALLQALIDRGLTLRLFCNDRRPKRGDRAADYKEASFPGYSPIKLAASVWKVEQGTAKSPTVATAPYQMFLRTTAGDREDVYGWYLTAPDGAVVCAERFEGAPWDVARGRDAVEVRPAVGMPG